MNPIFASQSGIRSVMRLIPAILVTALLGFPITGEAEDLNHYDEPGFSQWRDDLSQSFAEHIDPFTGNLMLHFVDLRLPVSGGFDLKVQRTYNRNNVDRDSQSPFGRGWDINFGRVRHLAGQACSAASPQTMTLVLPDGSEQMLHRSSGQIPSTTSSDYLTIGFWKGQCNASGTGVTLFAPDGTKFDMSEVDGAYWHVKRMTDRHGNYIDLEFPQFSGQLA